MPWELQAIPIEPAVSLGTVAQVQVQLLAAVPEIELFRDASGLEKLQAMESSGVEVSEGIREHWLRSKGSFQGFLQGDDFTIEFVLGEDENNVTSVIIDVRGGGEPMSVIGRLQAIKCWRIVDGNGMQPSAKLWKSFGSWRDDAIEQMDDEP